MPAIMLQFWQLHATCLGKRNEEYIGKIVKCTSFSTNYGYKEKDPNRTERIDNQL